MGADPDDFRDPIGRRRRPLRKGPFRARGRRSPLFDDMVEQDYTFHLTNCAGNTGESRVSKEGGGNPPGTCPQPDGGQGMNRLRPFPGAAIPRLAATEGPLGMRDLYRRRVIDVLPVDGKIETPGNPGPGRDRDPGTGFVSRARLADAAPT